MEDYSSLAFECILLPSTLDTKVFPDTIQVTLGVWRELLCQLSTVTKTQLAAHHENGGQPPDPGSLKKKAFIQLMVVRIYWSIVAQTPSMSVSV